MISSVLSPVPFRILVPNLYVLLPGAQMSSGVINQVAILVPKPGKLEEVSQIT